MKVYVETSVILRRIQKQPGMVAEWGDWELAVTSQLTRIEARRSLDRMRVTGRLADSHLANMMLFLQAATEGFQEIQITGSILERAASPFPTALGTLDAIHLATALAWIEEKDERLTMVTHDRELAVAALASGLDVWPKLRLPLG